MAALFGRTTEVRRIDALVADLPQRGAALVVRGDAGIGKSALLARAVSVAREGGMQVLGTTGTEAESHLDFAGLHQLLAPVLSLSGALAGPQRAAVLTAFGLADGPPPDLFLIALASLNLLAEAGSAAPVLVTVDDAHWLDPASAAVLAFVARRIAAEPIGLVASAREGFETAFDAVGPAVLRPGPLAPEDAEALLDEQAPDLPPAARATILASAEGNPLALTELPAMAGRLDPSGPWLPLTTRLEQAFAGRLGDLPATTVTALEVAALNDGDGLAETLTAAGTVAADLQPAIIARLVTVAEGRIRFRHPLIRSAVHHRIDGVRRLAVHTALARVLAGSPERHLWHRAAASEGPDERIAVELDDAAQQAQRRGAAAGAVRALELAARLSTDPHRRVQRLLRAATWATELGRRDDVDRLLAGIGPARLTPAQQARTAWVRGRFDNHLAESITGVRALVAFAREAIGRGESDLALDLLYAVGLASAYTEPGREIRESVVTAARQVGVPADDPRLLLVLAFAHPVACGAEVLARLRQWAARGVADESLCRALATSANAIGEYELCLSFAAPALAHLRGQGRLGLLARALAVQGRAAANLANLSIAVPAAEETVRLSRETSVPPVEALGWAQNAQIAALRGRFREFEECAAQAEMLATPLHAAAALATVQHARGLAALVSGRSAEAAELLLRIFTPGDPAYHLLHGWDSIGDLAEAAARGPARQRVTEIVAGLERVAEQMPTTALRVGLGYARAVLAADDRAEAALLEFLATGLTGWPFVRARAQLMHGAWLRRHRRRAESRVVLRAARDAFDALGTAPWGERARQELRASGETSTRRAPDALDRLTPQELQIAQLAADGLTNREIGQRLYVSHRTVSTHLHRIFPKLGITSRAELREALAGV